MSNETMSADEVLAAIDDLIDVPVVECLEDEEFVENAKRMRTAVADLLAERDALRETVGLFADDAQRYRWLRDHADSGVVDAPYVAVRSSKYPDRNGNPSNLSWSGPTAEGLDAAIDAACANESA